MLFSLTLLENDRNGGTVYQDFLVTVKNGNGSNNLKEMFANVTSEFTDGEIQCLVEEVSALSIENPQLVFTFLVEPADGFVFCNGGEKDVCKYEIAHGSVRKYVPVVKFVLTEE